MPLNAVGWTTEEDEKLIELVEPYKHLYCWLAHSRKNILARENTWKIISTQLFKPVEECKKRWRGLRDSYTRSKRMGAIHRSKVPIYEKLQFLSAMPLDMAIEIGEVENGEHILSDSQISEQEVENEQQVIMDGQEYYEHDYEVTLVNGSEHQEIDIKPQIIKILPKTVQMEQNIQLEQPPKKVGRKNAGRKRSTPLPRNIPPVKILPKPMIMSEPRLIKCVDDRKRLEERSQAIDKLIEKMLKENTNEIDVFFRSMAASVKKLQPNLIPKVKMEVCNVIAKYEMQSFDKNSQNI
ncbi:uncharacterized protein LOC120627974 [Pararge aegeria]|uniref:Jg13725 protein n=1 Tax=Pararge aegeria aegeria TaxID=348720 RepID=A0A8S4RQ70_9NEOP|nr:uncharacterized protein LOC120627974 [Pararge aegeria]CAH2238917.1 jg13725 [Pararge aegeria aegeria]